jgi:hypothetical protein
MRQYQRQGVCPCGASFLRRVALSGAIEVALARAIGAELALMDDLDINYCKSNPWAMLTDASYELSKVLLNRRNGGSQ